MSPDTDKLTEQETHPVKTDREILQSGIQLLLNLKEEDLTPTDMFLVVKKAVEMTSTDKGNYKTATISISPFVRLIYNSTPFTRHLFSNVVIDKPPVAQIVYIPDKLPEGIVENEEDTYSYMQIYSFIKYLGVRVSEEVKIPKVSTEPLDSNPDRYLIYRGPLRNKHELLQLILAGIGQ